MKVTCPNCRTTYRIDENKVPPSGARAKCANCGAGILIGRPPTAPHSPGLMDRSPGADFAQTMAYDFAQVDQSLTEVSSFLEMIADKEPFFPEGRRVFLLDGATGEEHPLEAPEAVIGRHGCDINLSDPEVSRRHCRVKVFGERIAVIDLDSTNGTYIGGRKVLTGTIGLGERFTIGNTTLEVVARPGA